MAAKSFKGQTNPAMQFITPPAAEGPAAQPKTTDAPEGYKVNPLYVETKSRRVQLLMQPSLYDKLKRNAQAEGLSVNEYIHLILEAAVKEG